MLLFLRWGYGLVTRFGYFFSTIDVSFFRNPDLRVFVGDAKI